MSPMAAFGLLGMFGALGWFAWCMVRVLIGPARGRAFGRGGLAALAFLGSGLFAGWNLGTPSRVATTGAPAVASPQSEAIAAGTSPEDATMTMPPGLAVSRRYQTSPTLVSLVVDGFEKGMEEKVSDLARSECGGAGFCSVGIWTDGELAPRQLRMTDAQVAGRLGQYVHSSKTGLDRFLWNCEVSRHPRAECLQ